MCASFAFDQEDVHIHGSNITGISSSAISSAASDDNPWLIRIVACNNKQLRFLVGWIDVILHPAPLVVLFLRLCRILWRSLLVC